MATASGIDAWWPTSSVVQASRPVCWPRCSAETAKIDSAITHSGRSSRVATGARTSSAATSATNPPVRSHRPAGAGSGAPAPASIAWTSAATALSA